MIVLTIAHKKDKDKRLPKSTKSNGLPPLRQRGWFAWSPKNKRWYASKKLLNARPFESEEMARSVISMTLPGYVVVKIQHVRSSSLRLFKK